MLNFNAYACDEPQFNLLIIIFKLIIGKLYGFGPRYNLKYMALFPSYNLKIKNYMDKYLIY